MLLLTPLWACSSEGVNRFAACPDGTAGRFSICPEPSDETDTSPDDPSVDDPPTDTTPPDAIDLATDPGGDQVLDPTPDPTPDFDAVEDLAGDDGNADQEPDDEPDEEPVEGPCPPDMAPVGAICMDLYEAPNVEGGLPFVMFHYREAEDWCEAQGKRLCFDDEWTLACAGSQDWAYPYGNTRVAGQCNDEETWRAYNQDLLNLWPWSHETDDIDTLSELYDVVSAMSSAAALAVDHIEALYQAEASGSNEGCVGEYAVFDLVGNVEEWTTRRDGGGGPELNGNLKGRYWAESRTCQSNVRSHGDFFRFYEIGFRCCQDQR